MLLVRVELDRWFQQLHWLRPKSVGVRSDANTFGSDRFRPALLLNIPIISNSLFIYFMIYIIITCQLIIWNRFILYANIYATGVTLIFFFFFFLLSLWLCKQGADWLMYEKVKNRRWNDRPSNFVFFLPFPLLDRKLSLILYFFTLRKSHQL